MPESKKHPLVSPFLIGINGPPGIGKSWLAKKLLTIVPAWTNPFSVKILGLRAIIWEEFKLTIRAEWDIESGDYEAMKSHIFADGMTGREKMIQHAEMRRAQDIHYWDRIFLEQMEADPPTILIHDSMRMVEEQNFFLTHFKYMMVIVISPTRYSIGMQYDGDSGKCLPPTLGFRATSSDHALQLFVELLNNVESQEHPKNGLDIWYRERVLGETVL